MENIIQKIKRENRGKFEKKCMTEWDIPTIEQKRLKLFLSLAEDNILKGVLEMIEGLKKKQTKHFSSGIEVEHHGRNPCNSKCIPFGKDQGGEYNQALNDIKEAIEK